MGKSMYIAGYHVNFQAQDFFFFCFFLSIPVFSGVGARGFFSYFFFPLFFLLSVSFRDVSPRQESKFVPDNCNSV